MIDTLFLRNSLHFTPLHFTPLHFSTLHSTPLHYTPLHYTTLHYTTTFHYSTLHFTILNYTPLHYIALHFTTLHTTSLQYTKLHYTTLYFTTLHTISLHSTTPLVMFRYFFRYFLRQNSVCFRYANQLHPQTIKLDRGFMSYLWNSFTIINQLGILRRVLVKNSRYQFLRNPPAYSLLFHEDRRKEKLDTGYFVTKN